MEKAGRRWVDGIAKDHADSFDAASLRPDEREALALGASSKALRDRLLRCYQALERSKAREAAKAGGFGRGPRYEAELSEMLKTFLDGVAADAVVRKARGGRAGRARSTFQSYSNTAAKLLSFVAKRNLKGLRAGDLTPDLLRDFRDHLYRSRHRGLSKRPAPPQENAKLEA